MVFRKKRPVLDKVFLLTQKAFERGNSSEATDRRVRFLVGQCKRLFILSINTSHQTLKREMREELGTEIHIERLLWIIENFFTLGETYHELGLYFLITFPAREQSPGLAFQWHPLSGLQNINLQPAFLRSALNAIPATTEHIVHIDTNTSTRPIT